MNIQKLKQIPIHIVVIVGILMVIGGMNVFATTFFPDKTASSLFLNQIGFYIIGIVVLFLLSITHYEIFKRRSVLILIFLATVGSLILVLIAGDVVLGARRWISLGGITIQPSELVRVAIIILTAGIQSIQKPVKQESTKTRKTTMQQLMNLCLDHFETFKIIFTSIFLLVFTALIMQQNSLGNSVLIIGIWSIMIFSYIPFTPKYLAVLVTLVLSVITFFNLISISNSIVSLGTLRIDLIMFSISLGIMLILRTYANMKFISLLLIFLISIPVTFGLEYAYNNFLQDYQRERIEVFFDPSSDPYARWNSDQVSIALGSGQFLGKGYLQGTHTNYKFLPFSFNDFAFAALGEQFGFVGISVIVSMYGILLWSVVEIAKKTKDQFGRSLVFGVSALLFLNTFQHMGMNVGILPITGVPLPFISYGGSSILAATIGVGLVLSVSSTEGNSIKQVVKHDFAKKSVSRAH